jgi:type II secretion system (T2SS) protein E
MTRLGQLLLRADLVTENHLARSLGVQHFAGGRIGTLLLERGALHEDDLGRTLAQQHGCEYVPWQVLDNVTPAAIAALPAKFAIRHGAVPYDRGEGFLRVALRDPSDLRILDELFFVTGRKIVPTAAPEVRIFQALEKYYGERRTPRYAILSEKLSRVAGRSGTAASPPPPPDFFPETQARAAAPGAAAGSADGGRRKATATKIPDMPALPWASFAHYSAGTPATEEEEEEEVISWEELSPPSLWIPAPAAERPETPKPSRAAAPPPPASASAVPPAAAETPPVLRAAPSAAPAARPRRRAARQESPVEPMASRAVLPAPSESGARRISPETFDFPEVLVATDRTRVVAEALAALSRRFVRVAVFGSKPAGVAGLAGLGPGIDTAKVAAIEIPWGDPSVFLNVRLSRAFYLGPLPPLPRHRPIAEAMGKRAEECVVQPVWIKDKPAAFLYAEFDPDRGATPMDLAYLRGLAAAVATALAASIRSKRVP